MYHKPMTKYTRATPDDIARIWKQLWGDLTPEQVRAITEKEDEMARTLNGNLTGKAASLDKSDNEFNLPLTNLEKVEVKGRVARKMQENMLKNGFIAKSEEFKQEAENYERLYILLRDGEEDADTIHALISAAESTEGKFTDAWSDPRTESEKAADAFNEEYSNDATISDIRTGFQQW